MKQTNNAIKFLMAQYRAIFKNAYFKGLATAALVTAGLAVGAAQAATITLPAENQNAITNNDSDNDFIIDGDAYFNGSNTKSSLANSVTIEQGGSLSSYPDNTPSGNVLSVKDSIVLNGGHLNLVKSWVSGVANITNVNPGNYTADLIDRGNSQITIDQSLLTVGTATLREGTTVTIGGLQDKSVTNYTENTWNQVTSSLTVQASGDKVSSLTINGADITLEDNGRIHVLNNNSATGDVKGVLTLNAGNITLAGSMLARANSSDGSEKNDVTTNRNADQEVIGSAIITTNGTANFNGGTITVQDGDFGQIHAATMNIKGTTFENAGTMQIGHSLKLSSGGVNSSTGAINMTAGAINNAGTLLLGATTDIDGKQKADNSVITAKGGTITNSSDGEVHVYSTLKMTGADIDNEGNLIVENGAKFELDEQKDNKAVDGVLTVGGTVQVDGQVRVSHGTLDLSTATSITTQGPISLTGNGDGGILVRSDTGVQDAVLKLTEQQAHDFLNTYGFVSGEQKDSAGYITVGKNGTVDFGDSVTLSNFDFWVVTAPAHQIADPSGKILVYSDTDQTFSTYSGANFKATTMTLEDALLRNDTTSAVEDLPATTLHADNLNLHYDGVETVKDFDGNFSFTDAVVGKNLDVTYKGGDNKLKLANSFELKAYTPSTTVNNQHLG